MKYQVIQTATADEQLRYIIHRIALTFDVNTALNALHEIEKAINRLSEFPEMGTPPRYVVLRRRRFLVLVVAHTLLFYKVEHTAHQVVVYAAVDDRQDYLRMVLGSV